MNKVIEKIWPIIQALIVTDDPNYPLLIKAKLEEALAEKPGRPKPSWWETASPEERAYATGLITEGETSQLLASLLNLGFTTTETSAIELRAIFQRLIGAPSPGPRYERRLVPNPLPGAPSYEWVEIIPPPALGVSPLLVNKWRSLSETDKQLVTALIFGGTDEQLVETLKALGLYTTDENALRLRNAFRGVL